MITFSLRGRNFFLIDGFHHFPGDKEINIIQHGPFPHSVPVAPDQPFLFKYFNFRDVPGCGKRITIQGIGNMFHTHSRFSEIDIHDNTEHQRLCLSTIEELGNLFQTVVNLLQSAGVQFRVHRLFGHPFDMPDDLIRLFFGDFFLRHF